MKYLHSSYWGTPMTWVSSNDVADCITEGVSQLINLVNKTTGVDIFFDHQQSMVSREYHHSSYLLLGSNMLNRKRLLFFNDWILSIAKICRVFHFDHWPKGHLTRPIVWGH